MIVVTGATGQAGSEVVRALAARGERVRAFVRDPGPARHKLGENIELAVGDLADPRSVRAALVDPRDVGEAAAEVSSSPGHEGRIYLVTGPAAITFTEVAAGLSAAVGRGIEFTDIPGEAAEQAMIAGGVPAFAAGQILRIFAQLRQGADRRVTATVQALAGNAPRDGAAFAADPARLVAPAAAIRSAG